MEIMRFEISGISPLLMHSNRGMNPFDPLTRQMKEITGKRKKTDEDLLAIQALEWQLALYWSEKEGAVIPGEIIEGSLYAAAKLSRSGPAAKRGIRCLEFQHKLVYDGPKDKEKLFECGRFVDVRPVRVSGRGIMRTRPIFDKWGLSFQLSCDTDTWNPADVRRLVEIAGSQIGICDFRPRYGRFEVKGST